VIEGSTKVDDQSKIATKPSMPAVTPEATTGTRGSSNPAPSVDEALKRELLDPIMTAMHAHAEETNALVERCITDQISIRGELAGLRAEVDAIRARGHAWDAADAGHSRALADGMADAKRLADGARADTSAALEAAATRHNELASKVDTCARELGELRTNVEAAVLEALATHVTKIEAAADKLTKTPQVRTAAAIGGTFAGSALVTIIVEIIKHL
jgi:hypothetical protein